MIKLQTKLKGFTLIEILIATTIFAMAAIIGATALTSVYRVEDNIHIQSSRQQAIRYIFEVIGREVRFAESIDLPVNGTTGPIEITRKKADGSTGSKTITYNSTTDVIGLDSQPLNTNDINITSFSAEGLDADNPYVKIKISVSSDLQPTEIMSAETILVPRGYTNE